jgi:hypothetical protein
MQVKQKALATWKGLVIEGAGKVGTPGNVLKETTI